MPSELDLAIDATIAKLMENDGPLTIGHVEKFGVQMPYLTKAPANVGDYFAAFCALHADKEFLVDGDIRLTFGDAYAAARALAGGLVEGHALVKGERVGIAARNSANWIVAYMAILMAGGVATLLNGWWQGGELAEGIRMVHCRFVLADAQRAARFAQPQRRTTAQRARLSPAHPHPSQPPDQAGDEHDQQQRCQHGEQDLQCHDGEGDAEQRLFAQEPAHRSAPHARIDRRVGIEDGALPALPDAHELELLEPMDRLADDHARDVEARREITFVCDECGEEHPSFTTDFHDALDDFKDDGNVVRLEDGEWHHYCKVCAP
mgnify:CR=1 FL=1